MCACVYESSEASAYSFGLATNPNPTRARGYPLNLNPKPDPKPESISGPAGSGRVADLYRLLPGLPTAPGVCVCVCVCVSTAPGVCALGWVKCREHISLLVILCIIVYVTNKFFSFFQFHMLMRALFV